MKIRIDVDCTPEEARAFLGLPDVTGLQQVWIGEVEKRIKEGAAAMDPETVFKQWMPAGGDMLQEMQKAFWSSFGKGRGEKPKEDR